jgi:uncharacterized protein (TIGR03086 family)
MTAADASMTVLGRALDQAGEALTAVRTEQLGLPTPCGDWDVAALIGHLVAVPGHFLEMARGEQPDWSAQAPVGDTWAADFRAGAEQLMQHWRQVGDAADAGQLDWQTAEIAVHTWDLVRATGQEVQLAPEVAERGLGFVSAMLTPENRGEAFGPPVDVPESAPVYDRLAAFTGRQVG